MPLEPGLIAETQAWLQNGFVQRLESREIRVAMKIIRICAEGEESRFQEVEVPIDQSRPDRDGHPSFMSKAYSSPDVRFVDLPEGFDSSWHHAPARQIVMILKGVLEVCTSDNQKRQWPAGELLFADDLTGKGHMTRPVGGPVRLLIVQFRKVSTSSKRAPVVACDGVHHEGHQRAGLRRRRPPYAKIAMSGFA